MCTYCSALGHRLQDTFNMWTCCTCVVCFVETKFNYILSCESNFTKPFNVRPNMQQMYMVSVVSGLFVLSTPPLCGEWHVLWATLFELDQPQCFLPFSAASSI